MQADVLLHRFGWVITLVLTAGIGWAVYLTDLKYRFAKEPVNKDLKKSDEYYGILALFATVGMCFLATCNSDAILQSKFKENLRMSQLVVVYCEDDRAINLGREREENLIDELLKAEKIVNTDHSSGSGWIVIHLPQCDYSYAIMQDRKQHDRFWIKWIGYPGTTISQPKTVMVVESEGLAELLSELDLSWFDRRVWPEKAQEVIGPRNPMEEERGRYE